MICVETHERVRTITLDRAEKKNALTPEMLRQLIDVFDDETDVHTTLVVGRGGSFCAGFDLAQCLEDEAVWHTLLTDLATVVGRLRACPHPVVIGAKGAAIAGGCALLAGADVVVTDRAAKIGYPVVKLGVSPAVSAPTLRHAIGDGATRARMLCPALIDGAEAARIGLAHHLVDERAQVDARAASVAEMLSEKSPLALRETKRLIHRIADPGDEWLGQALETSRSLVGSHDERARMRAIWGA